MTCDEAAAEDLVAETVARAWAARDGLKDEAAFRAWIFRILHNAFVSDRRRSAARPEVQPRGGEGEAEDEEAFSIFEQAHQPFLLWFSNPEQEFLDRVLRKDLERALCALPEHYRIVVVLLALSRLVSFRRSA